MQVANHITLTTSKSVKYMSSRWPATSMRDPVWGRLLTLSLSVPLIFQFSLQLGQSYSQECEAWKILGRCDFGSGSDNGVGKRFLNFMCLCICVFLSIYQYGCFTAWVMSWIDSSPRDTAWAMSWFKSVCRGSYLSWKPKKGHRKLGMNSIIESWVDMNQGS